MYYTFPPLKLLNTKQCYIIKICVPITNISIAVFRIKCSVMSISFKWFTEIVIRHFSQSIEESISIETKSDYTFSVISCSKTRMLQARIIFRLLITEIDRSTKGLIDREHLCAWNTIKCKSVWSRNFNESVWKLYFTFNPSINPVFHRNLHLLRQSADQLTKVARADGNLRILSRWPCRTKQKWSTILDTVEIFWWILSVTN